MDTLFHFIFSIIAGMAVFKGRHKVSTVAGLAFLSVLVDVDHFFGLGTRGTFHNVFIVFFVPVLAFLVFYYYERMRSVRLQTYALTLMVMLVGHVLTDMLYGGGVMLLYPVSAKMFTVPNFLFLASDKFYSPIVSRDGIILAIYSVVMLFAFYIENFIYFFEKRREKARAAMSEVKRKIFL